MRLKVVAVAVVNFADWEGEDLSFFSVRRGLVGSSRAGERWVVGWSGIVMCEKSISIVNPFVPPSSSSLEFGVLNRSKSVGMVLTWDWVPVAVDCNLDWIPFGVNDPLNPALNPERRFILAKGNWRSNNPRFERLPLALPLPAGALEAALGRNVGGKR